MITKNIVALTADATLRAPGLRRTRQRRIILEVVRATDAHPTAASVYRRVRRRLPRVSLATVYRNLRTLAAEGFVAERADPSGARFDGNTAPHDHFTCVACGRIYDVPPRADRAECEGADEADRFDEDAGAARRRRHGAFPLRHFERRIQLPNLDEAAFARMASDAEKNCPVSKVLKAEITLDAKVT